MKADLLAPLHDILRAGQAIQSFVAGRTPDEYSADEMLSSSVERKFEIIGEALKRITRVDPNALASIRHTRDIISFRNILVHGYDVVDDKIVWGIIQEELSPLLADVGKLLEDKTP